MIWRELKEKADQMLESEEAVEVNLLSVDELIANAKNDNATDHAAVLLANDQLKNFRKKEI